MKVSIPFMKGVQTKVEHQILPSGDLTLLENGEFNKIGSIEKRKGYSTLAVEDGNLKKTDLISHGKDLIARNVSSDPKNTPLSAEAYSLANGRFTGRKGVSQGIGYTSMPVSAGSSYRQENPQVAFSDDGKYALVTFVALESEDESTTTSQSSNILGSLTGIVAKKCTLIDRETNTIIASDIPIGRNYGQGDVSATGDLSSEVYKYQGSRMKPVWNSWLKKFIVFGVDAKTTGVTATPYEPTFNIYAIDPTREPIQVSNLEGEYSLTATYGTEAALPSGWSIPNKLNSSFPYGPDKENHYGFSFDVCKHEAEDKFWVLATLFDGTNAKVELHQETVQQVTSPIVALTDPEESHNVTNALTASYAYMENVLYRASNGDIYYAFLGDSAETIDVYRYTPDTGVSTLIDMDPASGSAAGYPLDAGSPRYGFYRGFFVETDKPRVPGADVDVDFYLTQVPMHSPEEGVQSGTGGSYQGESQSGNTLYRNSTTPHKNKTLVFESLSNTMAAGNVNVPVEKMVYKPALFAFGHTEGSSPKGPTTIGAYPYDIFSVSDRASANELNTIELFTTDLSDTIFSGGYAQQGGHDPISRDHLGVAAFDPSHTREALKVADYSGPTENLVGKALALPVVTNFNAQGDKLIANSVIHLFDFRKYGAAKTRPSASSAVLNDILYVADDGLFSYDGDKFWNHGILDKPSIFINQSSPFGGGMTNNATYSYKAVYEWEDAKGNLHQGAPSGIAFYTTPENGSTQTRVDYFATAQVVGYEGVIGQESKRDMNLAVYRTSANGSLMTLNKATPFSGRSFYYNDEKSDAENAIGRLLYTDTGELENTPPPSPSVYVVAHKNRLFTIGKDGLIYFSKLSVTGFGLGFHPGFVVKTPDRISDPPMALGSMDGLLYIFTKNTIYYLGGEGPDNTGSGSFYEPKRVPSSVGAIERSPVLSIESGLLFVSPKGIYLLDREQKIQYIGAPVEDLIGDSTIKDMIIDQEKETVYLQTDSSSSQALAYDYRMNQWSSVVLPSGKPIDSIALWRDKIRFSSDGKLWSESSALRKDGDEYIPLKMKTAWIKLPGRTGATEASNQGYQRAYNFQVLGTSKDAHGLKISVRYDYDNDSAPDVYSFETTDAEEAKLQFKGHLKKQKCQAIQFEIEDYEINQTQTGAGYSITEIVLELGYKADQYKNGVMRIPAHLTSTSTIH